ncbi:MAG: hypothetical protein GXO69_08470 [Acidobacteria bacterium]|nr:hypothetical protein [Acidobacteriota bacterium]
MIKAAATIFLIFFPMLFSPLHVKAKGLILRGGNCDYLYDIESGSIYGCGNSAAAGKWNSRDSAYYFAGKCGVFRFCNGKIASSVSGVYAAAKNAFLPFPSGAQSIQEMVHGGNLYLPVRPGFLVFNLSQQSAHLLPYPWRLHPVRKGGLELAVPGLADAGGSLWVLDSGHLRRFSGGRWVEVMQVPEKDLIETRLLAGKKFVNLLLFKVTQGDLGSFRTRILSFSAIDGQLLMDREFDGVLKNPAADRPGRIVYEYVNASLLSALWGRKKVKLRVIDPGKKKVFTDAYSVGDKRRHLFYLFGRRGALLLVVQCKNGDIFVIRPFQGRMRKLRKVKFGYDFTLIRGVGNGVFYNEKTGNRIAVSFDSDSGGS